MHNILFALCLCFTLTLSAQRNHLISFEKVDSYSKETLQELWADNSVPEFISPVNYGVEVYEVLYWTKWHDGSKIKASGYYWLPIDKRSDLPFACYNHGSRSKRAHKVDLGGEQLITTALAADGYAVIMPDYIGLGKGDKFHLYMHAESEAYASIDMIRAVREMNVEIEIELNEYLFLSGYSQGGHAAMATHKMMQEKYPDEFNVTASAPMSGAYDLAGVQRINMFEPYTRPAYLAYLIQSYNEVYGFYDDVRNVFKHEFGDTVISMLESQKYTLSRISKVLPVVPAEALTEEVVKMYVEDPDAGIGMALKVNSNHDWAPENPMMICYCKSDEEVSYLNAKVAHENMKDKGSKHIRLRHAGKKFDHRSCALYTSIYTKMYFDSFLKGSKKGRKGPVTKRFLISLGKIGAKP
ncbi:MAG: hypothetical protein ACI959_000382 [Limisphaerales bacterium]|jgi:hypothetical protein